MQSVRMLISRTKIENDCRVNNAVLMPSDHEGAVKNLRRREAGGPSHVIVHELLQDLGARATRRPLHDEETFGIIGCLSEHPARRALKVDIGTAILPGAQHEQVAGMSPTPLPPRATRRAAVPATDLQRFGVLHGTFLE